MFVLVILGVAAVVKSVPVSQSTEDATKMPKLQLAFLVEDVDYQQSQLQKLQHQIARSGKKYVGKSRTLTEENNEIEDGYGRGRRSSLSEDPFRSQVEEEYGRRRRSPQSSNSPNLQTDIEENPDDQIAVESASRVSALNIANILRVAGATPTEIVRQGGYGRKRRSSIDSSNNELDTLEITDKLETEEEYGRRRRSSPKEDPFRFRVEGVNGRRRRSPQNNQVLPLTDLESQDDQIAVESENRVSALNIANILKIAGAEPTPIDRQEGYGRKRRSPMDSSSNDFDSLEVSEKLQSSSQSGGSDKRRKRSPQIIRAHPNAHQYGLVDTIDSSSVGVKPHGKYGEILALSGAKPQAISGGVSYGRKKRSPKDLSDEIITNEIQTGTGLVKNVAIEAVKIKSHGKYGNIAQIYDAGAKSKNVIFNGRFGRRKREDNFIPFNVYDERRVKTLKIEQNDFLALQSRLQIEKENSERNVKKRHFTASQ